MSFHRKSHGITEHHCSLKQEDTTGLPKLPPNASCFAKLLRFFRRLTLLNTTYIESRTFFRNKSAMIAERKRHAKGYFFVLHPFSTFTFMLDWLFLVVWTFEMFSVVIELYLPIEKNTVIGVISGICNFTQVLVMFSFFIQGYIDGHNNNSITIQPIKIIKHYLKTYFVIDLMTVCLYDSVGYFISLKEFKKNHFEYHYLIASTVMLTYFIRTSSLISTLERIVHHYGLGDHAYFLFSRTIATLFFLHAFTCVMASLPRLLFGDDLPKDIFLVKAKLHDLSTGTNTHIIDIFTKTSLLVTCTFFGLDYDKVLITEISDYIPLIFIRVFGRMFTLFTLASFLKYFGRSGIAESEYLQYYKQIKEFMESKNVPDDLRKRILTYYEFKMQRNYFDEKTINSTLSVQLRKELFLYGGKNWIDKIPLLRSIDRFALSVLFSNMTIETYVIDEVVFDCGEELSHIYFIGSGTLIIYNKDGKELDHFTDGEQIGLINMWTRQPSQYKVVAGEPTEIYRIHQKYMIEFLHDQYQLTKYYENIETERAKNFANTEELMKGQGSDVIAQLKEQKILEKRTVRTIIFD